MIYLGNHTDFINLWDKTLWTKKAKFRSIYNTPTKFWKWWTVSLTKKSPTKTSPDGHGEVKGYYKENIKKECEVGKNNRK